MGRRRQDRLGDVEILDLSEQTVVQYVKSATRQLGAQNKGHAIAEAMRAALII